MVPRPIITAGGNKVHPCSCELFGCIHHQTILPGSLQFLQGRLVCAATYYQHQAETRKLNGIASWDGIASSAIISRTLSRHSSFATEHDAADLIVDDCKGASDLDDFYVIPEDNTDSVLTDEVQHVIDDLVHISVTLNQHILAFTIPNALRFAYTTTKPVKTATKEQLDLDPSCSLNAGILLHQRRMLEIQALLSRESFDADSTTFDEARSRIANRVGEELDRIREIKEWEWKRQRAFDGSKSQQSGSGTQAIFFDNGMSLLMYEYAPLLM